MDLKTVFTSISQRLGKEEDAGEQLLAIKISTSEVTAAIWKIEGDKVQLGQVSESPLTGQKFEELLEATDKAVSFAPDTIKKVIFGLPFYWVTDGKIVEEKLSLLRRLCKELGLTPLGYVLLSEALENYYKEIEGAPLTAILLEIDGDQGLLTMYRAGKNLGTVPLKTEGQITEELEKALKSFTQTEILPSRIIIYDGQGGLEKIAEKITASPWTKSLPFLHFPKVEVFDSSQVVKAIAVAGGMQMGGHFEIEEEPIPELEEISAQEAGFVEMELPEEKKETKIGIDYKEKLTAVFSFLSSKLPKTRATPIIILFIAVVLFLTGLAIYNLPKTTVLLRVSSPPFDKELAVSVTTEKSTKPATDSAKVITGSLIDVSEIGTKNGVASGHKLVGDKARGNVTIHSASGAKNFAAGSLLASPNGLKFTLDKEVSIASGDAITRATVTGSVTAADIGDSYNLAAGTKFTIGALSISDYAAQADQALSGGSSHQATVVTREDQSRLIATLSAELTEKAKADLEAKLEANKKLLPNATVGSVAKKKFSKDVDTEADTISLDLTMDFVGVVFSQADLVAVFAHNFASDIPSGFVLSADQALIDIKDIKTDKFGNAVLRVHLTSGLLPKIDLSEIIKNISGKSLSQTQSYLGKIPGVASVSVETKPKIFAAITRFALPWKKESLKLEVIRL